MKLPVGISFAILEWLFAGFNSHVNIYPGVESMVTAVAMHYKVQKLPRVRGGSYTDSAIRRFVKMN